MSVIDSKRQIPNLVVKPTSHRQRTRDLLSGGRRSFCRFLRRH